MALFKLPERDASKEKTNKALIRVQNPELQMLIDRSGDVNNANLIASIQQARNMLEDVDTDDLILINTSEIFHRFKKELEESEYIYLDTETTGLSKRDDKIVGFCLAGDDTDGAYIPILHVNHMTGKPYPGQIDAELVVDMLDELLDMGKKFVFHNANYDIMMIANQFGLMLPCYHDTQIAGNYLNENESHALKYLYANYVLGEDSRGDNYSDIFSGVRFDFVPIDVAYKYAAGDATKTRAVFKFQAPYLTPGTEENRAANLEDAAKFFHEVEMPLISCTCDMEYEGIDIDYDAVAGLAKKYGALMKEAEDEFLELTADVFELPEYQALSHDAKAKLERPINVGSNKQLEILLYDILGYKPKGKSRSVDEEALKYLDNDISDAVLSYRKTAKMLSTYVEKMPTIAYPETKRIHATFKPYGAVTGRFSSADPNLQNIPTKDKAIRQMFIPPEGYYLVSADYSQQEPRTLAHVSGDPTMIGAYMSGKDIYATVASFVYDLPYEECLEFRPDGTINPEGKKRRTSMKSVVLGLMYGRGVKSIAEGLGIPAKKAKEIISLFFERFPKVATYIDQNEKNAYRSGYVQTVWGLKRRLPELWLEEYEVNGAKTRAEVTAWRQRLEDVEYNRKAEAKLIKEAKAKGVTLRNNGGHIAHAERQCINSVIQGSAANMIKKAMVLIHQDQEFYDLGGRLLITIHDELIAKVPKENAVRCAEIMEELMILAPTDKMKIPMKVDVEITDRWYGSPINL